MKTNCMMNLNNLIANNEYTVILCLGDSITEANHCSEGYPGYVALLDNELRLIHSRRKFLLVNAGIGGTRASESVAFISKLTARIAPQFCTLMYGMNDCNAGLDGLPIFAEALMSIVNTLCRMNTETTLLTQNPLDYSCDIRCIMQRQALPAYMDTVRDCAAKTGSGLIDIHSAWTKNVLERDNNEHFKLLHDGIHPNQHGHRFIFEQIKKHILS